MGSVSRQGEKFPPDSDRWSIGLNLSFPFFPGGQNIFNLQSALAEMRRVEHTLRSTREKLIVKLRQSLTNYQDAVGQATVAGEFLVAARERATIARGKYGAGLMVFDDWNLIESDLITREKADISNRKESVLSEADWELSLGKSALPTS